MRSAVSLGGLHKAGVQGLHGAAVQPPTGTAGLPAAGRRQLGITRHGPFLAVLHQAGQRLQMPIRGNARMPWRFR
jgi:hypothetical protein